MLRRFLLLALAATPAFGAPPDLPRRFTVPTIIVNRSPAVTSDLLTWKDLLQSDLNALASGGLTMLSGAGRIRFARRDAADMPSVADIASRWRQENAIQVITAVGTQQAGQPTQIEGAIYLGDLAGGLPGRTVTLPPTIRASSYRDSRDMVRATILYALANDAGGYKPAACLLLGEANKIRGVLARRKVALGGLGGAIDQRLAAVGCAVVR